MAVVQHGERGSRMSKNKRSDEKTLGMYNEKVKQCICCWYDLLGFGAPLVKAKWDLSSAAAIKALERIESVAPFFMGPFSQSYDTKIFLNDGAASNYDLDLSSGDSIKKALLYLEGLFTDFEALNDSDVGSGNAGVRGIVTTGYRYHYLRSSATEDFTRQGGGSPIISYHPKEFQMNTAFSKAYIVDDAGTAAGFSKPSIYVDQELFSLFDADPFELRMIKQRGELVLDILQDRERVARVFLELPGIRFNRMGIHTTFYRFLRKRTKIDDIFEVASLVEAQRYAAIDGE